MRWRRFAANVCPTETDSIKPTMLIKSAGTASSRHSPRSHSGIVSGGKPCGIVPTIFTPADCQLNTQVSAVVAAIAATGPAFAITSAAFAEKPKRIITGLKPKS